MTIPTTNNKIILTGAGFSSNFGALLGSGMWTAIFNHPDVQSSKRVKECLLRVIDTYDYEYVHYCINKGIHCWGGNENQIDTTQEEVYNSTEIKAINDALKDAYDRIDNTIKSTSLSNYSVFIKLINSFFNKEQVSYFFTLNQDLLIERKAPSALTIPGFDDSSEVNKIFSIGDDKHMTFQAPNDRNLSDIKTEIESGKRYFYVKLHGSCNWTGSDGKDLMIIGQGRRPTEQKEAQIANEPLLAHYMDIFNQVICAEKMKHLLVIGYSFRDDHINDIIVKAIKNSHLKLHIIDPKPIGEFIKNVLSLQSPFGKRLSALDKDVFTNSISGYYQWTKNVYLEENSMEFDVLKKCFFDAH